MAPGWTWVRQVRETGLLDNGAQQSEDRRFDPDNGAPIVETEWHECHSGEAAIYSLEYLRQKYGRETA